MCPTRDPVEPALVEFVRIEVARVLGSGALVAEIAPLGVRDELATLLVRFAQPARSVVFKAAGEQAPGEVDFGRTALAMGLARDAGAPAPETLAVDGSFRAGPWQYLLHEYVDGLEWRRVRPQLDDQQLVAAYSQIAEALLAVQSVRLAAFGELGGFGQRERQSGPREDELVASLQWRAAQRIVDVRSRERFLGLLERDAELFAPAPQPTLCHDDLHSANLIWRRDQAGWRLAALIDWDKAWAGPAESDLARMAFWDDMTGPGFWQVYRAAVPASEGADVRALIYQLLWCLEYAETTPRHLADTARLCRRLGLEPPA